MDGGVYAGGAEGARSGREGGATRHAIGSHAAPAFVEKHERVSWALIAELSVVSAVPVGLGLG
jgi:hypothetical protein